MPADDFRTELTRQLEAVRRYALALTRSRADADDLVQDCVAKAIAAADRWQPGTDLRAWLFRILYTTHISQMRKRQVRDLADRSVPGGDEPGAEGAQMLRVELAQVLAALDELPPGQREAVSLVALEDATYDTLARRLGIPVGTLMSRLARGREALRQRLEGSARAEPDGAGARKGRARTLRIVGGRDDA